MEKNLTELIEEIQELLSQKNLGEIRSKLIAMNPYDIAELFEEMDFEEDKVPLLFRLLPKELAAETFVEMDDDTQKVLINSFSDSELKEIIDELYLDDAVGILEEMPANVVKRILRQTDSETRLILNELLNYPSDSAGSMMTPEFVTLRPKMTVEEAIKRIRRTGVDKETIYTCYVTNNNKTLIGVVTIKTLILAEDDAIVEELMESNVISVRTTDDQENVAQMFNNYNFLALPVVDTENRLVGIVTIDDAIDVLEEEATEDIQKMAAISPSDKPYFKLGILEAFKIRTPWLLFLMISATFTGMIINNAETSLAALPFLTAYIPMLMNTGGSAGSQASVTIIRAISLGEVSFFDILKIAFKESRIALCCGVALAVCNFAKMMLFDNMVMHNSSITPMVAAVVCLTLVFNVLFAKVIGCCLPLIAKKFGADPAVMATPFISTIVDAITLTIYFTIATVLLVN
ncbi:MAG: magnesium transporter [Oscillospiraceae bacterium]|nr:magnesium transporter [Oscillospiraceae bacterium]